MELDKLLEKASTYNVFNFLFPGTLFAIFSKLFANIDITVSQVFAAPFVYYFYGMAISRVGSLILEPILKRLGFIKYVEYSLFISASKTDAKIDVLSETNNIFRTLIAMLICLLALQLAATLTTAYPVLVPWLLPTMTIALTILFVASWRKQTDYIRKRCESSDNNSKTGAK